MGVIDGAENTLAAYMDLGHYEIAPFYNLTGHMIIPDHLVIAGDTLATMSTADQRALRTACEDAISYCYEQAAAYNAAARAKAEERGVSFTEADTMSFQTRCSDIIAYAADRSSVTRNLYSLIISKRT